MNVSCTCSAHVHLNQPGRTSWEGFTSGTYAAVSGGVTTVIDMPLNSIPSTTSVGALEVKVKAARYGWENWRSLEEAQRLLGGNAGAKHKSGMGVGAGWGKGRLGEKELHEHEDHDGDVDVEEALDGLATLDDSDEEMAIFNQDDPVPIKRMSRNNSRSNSAVGLSSLTTSTSNNGHGSAFVVPRLLDILGPADSFAGKNKGVWCDVGFWGGIVPGNKVRFYMFGDQGCWLMALPISATSCPACQGRCQGLQVLPDRVWCRCQSQGPASVFCIFTFRL